MTTKRDPERIPVMSYIPKALAAKMKTQIEGRTVHVKTGYGKMSENMRPMGMSDFVIEACIEQTRGVKPSKKALRWVAEKTKRN